MAAAAKEITMDDKIGERIRTIRNRLNLSQLEFGRRAGVTKQAVSAWESDKRTPDRDSLTQLRDRLAINPDWIITGQPPPILERQQVAEPATKYTTNPLRNVDQLTQPEMDIVQSIIDGLLQLRSDE